MLLNLVYLIALILLSPWLVYRAVTTGRYREGLREKLLGSVPKREGDPNQKCFWLHAVSVGEVNLLGRLIEEIQKQLPEVRCVISTTTKTGMELARKKYGEQLTVFYCPFDFTWAVRRAIQRIRPDVLILAELELWPNLIRAARRQGSRVAVVNGRLSENSFRGYRRVRFLLRPVLRCIDLVAAQDESYAKRFRQLGIDTAAVHVTGSMKYDGATTDRDNPRTLELARLAGITPEDTVFLAGSTQEPEEQAALDAYQKLVVEYPSLRLILVPRHPERFDTVARLLDESGMEWVRRSELKKETTPPNVRVLLVDTIGELGAWWGTARIAFVGGSFGSRGGQNMIEPAAYGAAVSFGPNTRNFRDIVSMMLARDAAVVVADPAELHDFVERCLKDLDYSTKLGDRARELVRSQLGATARTVELLAKL
ncbi:MAG: 3-deoxy-D-manno-octulosonic acid transferase [Planctomycetia bacterium]|jgi:3-deoxy-D-manno-octulosonic-acid transferase